MKTLLILVLAALPMMGSAQTALTKDAMAKPGLTAGDELIKAKNHYLFGAALIGLGTLMTVMPMQDIEEEDSKPMRIAGSVVSVVGLIMTLESFGHIGKAGRIMNEKGVAINASPGGIRICMNIGK